MKYTKIVVYTFLSCCAINHASGNSGSKERSLFSIGKELFQTIFNPDRIFADEITPGSTDQIIMTAVTSLRNDYMPHYSLAIAYKCVSVDDQLCEGRYIARMLRIKATDETWDRSFYAPENLEWLEVNLWECEGAIAAMESVRRANWAPDIHYALLDEDDRGIILHPALIRIKMNGTYATTTYQGWVLADGAPEAVRNMVSTLDECWQQAKSTPPWKN